MTTTQPIPCEMVIDGELDPNISTGNPLWDDTIHSLVAGVFNNASPEIWLRPMPMVGHYDGPDIYGLRLMK